MRRSLDSTGESVASQLWGFAKEWLAADAYYSDARGVKRPFILRTLYLCGVLAVILAIIFAFAAPLNVGEYYINGRALTGREFLAQGGWFILPALGIIGWRVAADLRWGRPRVRVVLLGVWALGLLAWRPDMPDAVASLTEYFLVGVVIAWYLFRKASSRAYFGAAVPRPDDASAV
jgi:hypothetical protein